MRERHSKRSLKQRVAVAAIALGAIGVFAPAPARAHFTLNTPTAWMSQDAFGSPQKMGPCGDEGGGTATGTVTAFHPGETITIAIDEKIYHPGHYRIALSTTNRSQLPAEPTVTPSSSSPCGTVPVQNPAVFPVLADGVFTHTAPFNSPQTVQITLPSNVTCTKCTLQVIEFMSDHPLNNPGGCFYHHCADIAIQQGADPDGSAGNPDSGGTPDASSGGDDASSGDDASTSPDDSGTAGHDSGAGFGNQDSSSMGSCGCSIPGDASPIAAGVAGLFGIVTLLRRRRRP